MRVCFITPVLDAFKGGNHLPLLAALPDVQCMILTNATKPAAPAFPSHIQCETLSVRLGSYYYGWSDYLFARAVMKRYPAHHSYWKQFDVIHINQTMGPALLALKDSGVSVCFFVHHPASVDREVAVRESSGIEAWKWRLKYAMLVRWQRAFCRAMPHVATVSRTAAQRIAADYGVDAAKIAVVPNGVDTGEFMPAGAAKADFDVIAVGSFIHPRKGFPYMLEAYRSLSDSGFRIADVGRRTAAQQQALREIPNVRLCGMVSQEELLSLLQRSSALLSTSLYEGFGLSLIEALACGRPAFAFDGGAVGEVLRPVDPALVVPLRDTEALTARVREFLALPVGERAERGERYRQAVMRLYPLRQSADALGDLYRRLAARPA